MSVDTLIQAASVRYLNNVLDNCEPYRNENETRAMVAANAYRKMSAIKCVACHIEYETI